MLLSRTDFTSKNDYNLNLRLVAFESKNPYIEIFYSIHFYKNIFIFK